MTRFEIDYTKSDMKAFFDDISKKKLIKSLVLTYSVIGIVIFLIFLAAMYFMNGGVSFARPLPFVFLGVLAVLVFLGISRAVKNTPDKMYSKFSELYDGSVVICAFDEDRIYISSFDENQDSTDVINENEYVMYSDIYKVVETDNYFYIFINNSTAQIVRKSALVEGSVEEVCNYLKKYIANYEDLRKYRRN